MLSQLGLGRSAQPAQRAAAHTAQHAVAWTNAGHRLAKHWHQHRDINSHVCQAHPRRVAKVASQIQREISEMFIFDDVLSRAISPERGQGQGNLSAIAGITHVYVSNDLQVVKAYVSIYSDQRGKAQAMTNLKRLEPYVRSQIGQRVNLRLTPEVRFEYDDSIEEEELVQQVLGQEEYERLANLAASEAAAGGAAPSAAAAAGFGGDDDDDDSSGFFDFDVEGEAAGGAKAGVAAAAAVGGAAGAAAAAGGAEEDGFEEYEVEEDFGEEEEYKGRWYDQPGPFDDLFAGGGEDAKPSPGGARGKKKGRGNGAGRSQRPKQKKAPKS